MVIDWGGVATLIGAVGGFITVVGTFIMQVISYRDARRAKREQEEHKQTLAAINTKVDAIVKADTA